MGELEVSGAAEMVRDEEWAAFLQGFGTLCEACAAVLLNEPAQPLVDNLVRVAHALGDGRFDGIVADEALQQRFVDRTIVSCSPYFVPLTESCVTKRVPMDGRVRYGSYESAAGDHVLRCYKAVGFDYAALEGYAFLTTQLRPDAMACELAFMASLAHAAAPEVAAGKESHAEELLLKFAGRHTRWFDAAAECLAASDDDLYARTAAFAAESVAALRDVEA